MCACSGSTTAALRFLHHVTRRQKKKSNKTKYKPPAFSDDKSAPNMCKDLRKQTLHYKWISQTPYCRAQQKSDGDRCREHDSYEVIIWLRGVASRRLVGGERHVTQRPKDSRATQQTTAASTVCVSPTGKDPLFALAIHGCSFRAPINACLPDLGGSSVMRTVNCSVNHRIVVHGVSVSISSLPSHTHSHSVWSRMYLF